MPGIYTHVTMEAYVREEKPFAHTFIGERPVPARQALFTIFDIFSTQHFIQRISQRHFARRQLSRFDYLHRKRAFSGDVIGVLLLFFETPLQSGREKIG